MQDRTLPVWSLRGCHLISDRRAHFRKHEMWQQGLRDSGSTVSQFLCRFVKASDMQRYFLFEKRGAGVFLMGHLNERGLSQ